MFTFTRGGRRPGGRAALGTLLLTLWLALLTVPASAHDALTDSDPAQDSVLTELPEELVLTFSGEISDLGVQFMVTGPEGRDVVQGTAEVDDTVVTQNLADELTNGDYEALWRVTSSDGHPISGTINFSIAVETPTPSGEEATEDETTATDSAGAGATPTATETSGEPSTTPTPTQTDQQESTAGAAAAAVPDPATDPDGIPTWGWVVAALAAVGLVASGFLALKRK